MNKILYSKQIKNEIALFYYILNTKIILIKTTRQVKMNKVYNKFFKNYNLNKQYIKKAIKNIKKSNLQEHHSTIIYAKLDLPKYNYLIKDNTYLHIILYKIYDITTKQNIDTNKFYRWTYIFDNLLLVYSHNRLVCTSKNNDGHNILSLLIKNWLIVNLKFADRYFILGWLRKNIIELKNCMTKYFNDYHLIFLIMYFDIKNTVKSFKITNIFKIKTRFDDDFISRDLHYYDLSVFDNDFRNKMFEFIDLSKNCNLDKTYFAKYIFSNSNNLGILVSEYITGKMRHSIDVVWSNDLIAHLYYNANYRVGIMTYILKLPLQYKDALKFIVAEYYDSTNINTTFEQIMDYLECTYYDENYYDDNFSYFDTLLTLMPYIFSNIYDLDHCIRTIYVDKKRYVWNMKIKSDEYKNIIQQHVNYFIPHFNNNKVSQLHFLSLLSLLTPFYSAKKIFNILYKSCIFCCSWSIDAYHFYTCTRTVNTYDNLYELFIDYKKKYYKCYKQLDMLLICLKLNKEMIYRLYYVLLEIYGHGILKEVVDIVDKHYCRPTHYCKTKCLLRELVNYDSKFYFLLKNN